jgi:epoxyqueuosine reductase QueG
LEQLSIEIKNALVKEGASLVGFADMKILPPDARSSLDFGISVGVALNAMIIGGSVELPNMSYYNEVQRANSLLKYLGEFAARLLVEKGYKAIPILPNDLSELDSTKLRVPFQHKTVATRAGLGWIGKQAMLVTEEYGNAIRLCSVLTNAPLDCAKPIEDSKCGECKECANVCPGKAISGVSWNISRNRDEFFDAFKCYKVASGYKKALGLEAAHGLGICGKCIVVCPRTKKYCKN